MARELRQFTATIPAGTPLAAPATVALTMPARIVRRVRARIPPGHNGLVGWALAASGVNVIPWNPGAWIVGDDEELTWDLEGQITSGAWQLRGYNTGVYAHAVYLVFELDPPQIVQAITTGGPIETGQLYGPPAESPPPEPAPSPEPAPEPAPEPEPPPAELVDGYAIGRRNALAAVEAATGGPVTTPAAPPPDAGSGAAVAYDAARAAALAALQAI
jgi:hypothetical protein